MTSVWFQLNFKLCGWQANNSGPFWWPFEAHRYNYMKSLLLCTPTVCDPLCTQTDTHSRAHIRPCILKGHQQQTSRLCVLLWVCNGVPIVWMFDYSGKKKKKMIMWHQTETHYELWMNFALVDEARTTLFTESGGHRVVFHSSYSGSYTDNFIL